jgi:hypothetical protein
LYICIEQNIKIAIMINTQDPYDEFYQTLRSLNLSIGDWRKIAEAGVKLGNAKYKQGIKMVKEVYNL